MAFEIGERVTSSWTGPGTITGPLVRVQDEDSPLGIPHQRVKLDTPLFGQSEILRPVAKLLPYVDPPQKRKPLLDRENPVQDVKEYVNPNFPPPALLGPFDNVKKVRIIASEELQDRAIELFDRLDIDFPSDWRGTKRGKRGGSTVQFGISGSVTFKDGRPPVNDAWLILRTLSEGRARGWRITESV